MAVVLASLLAGCLAASTAATATTDNDVVHDSFARKTGSGLGSATQGGAYITKSSSTTAVSVDGSGGIVRMTKGGSGFEGTLPKSSIDDTIVSTNTTVSSPPASGSGIYRAVIARKSGGRYYQASARTQPNGQTNLWITRFDGSNAKPVRLGNVIKIPQSVKGGSKLTIQMRVTGDKPVSVKARAWLTSTSAPEWQTTVLDSSDQRISGAGSVGIWSYLSTTSPAATVRFEQLTASTFVEASPTPTPPTPTPPTPTPTTPTPDPIENGDRGSVAVGSARYAVPKDAIFVSTTGSSSGSGSLSNPFATIAQAVSRATSGTTIVVREGNYHEFVSTSSSKQVTIQNYPGEKVWLDGSAPVSTWKKSGSTWVASGWTAEFSSNASYVKGLDQSKSFIDPAFPMASYPDQVFVNGAPLRQVKSASLVKPGAFAVDYSKDTLTIGSDPSGKSVRASDLPTAIQFVSPKSTLQGIGVRRYASQMAGAKGAVYVAGSANGSIIRDVVIEDSATQGLAIIKPDIDVQRVTVRRAGGLGILATAADRLRIRDSIVEDNNVEHFNVAPSAGGIKVSRLRGLTITNNTVRSNINSMGIWTDESTVGIKVTGNTVIDNGSVGIHLELSEDGIVADNVATGNKTGVQVYNTGNVKIYNNDVGGNRSAGVKLMQDQRRQATWATGRDKRQPVPDPTNPWITRNITVANNIFTAGGETQIYAFDIRTGVHADTFVNQIAGNQFASTSGTMFLWGVGGTKSERYATTQSFNATRGVAWRNSTISGAPTGPTDASVAIPLPTDVASAISQAAGSRKLGPYTTG
ncbi:right-handed parallel beta-helix repeat-containing protein [Aeromicrobium sp.]|uniref:right-handed parallel beta-helix repeat-containing protein n=1 Tax=Aeromicrobium sp. TaxID=1871063 RepID=UPI0019CBFEE1|nr:right-handed parallel beta-helix repeat-containing protein [Aeromicrobium sp.]MBC7632329.1 right-handed parallel beta-helix repeat-containing protein [Aeromicrobium sp.]